MVDLHCFLPLSLEHFISSLESDYMPPGLTFNYKIRLDKYACFLASASLSLPFPRARPRLLCSAQTVRNSRSLLDAYTLSYIYVCYTFANVCSRNFIRPLSFIAPPALFFASSFLMDAIIIIFCRGSKVILSLPSTRLIYFSLLLLVNSSPR